MKNLPRVKLAHLPTPIESLPRLSAKLGGPNILIKRDDQTGLAFGGNKTRKLEFLVGEAQELGAKTLVTAGAVQSNHCRQTAAAAARFGFKCTLVLAGDPPQYPSANYLLDQLFDVDVIWTDWETRVEALQREFENLMANGDQPYLVPYGGSNSIGAAGYAYAIRELVYQEVHPDWIVFPSSSGGTQAGMVAGAALYSFKGKILGISVDEPAIDLKENVSALASSVTANFEDQILFKPEDILVNDDYCEAGYGVLTDHEIEAVRMFAREEGILLDPVYTGRAAWGLIDLVGKGYFSPDDTVLFWHTGGTPALFAEKYRNIVDRD
jgi:D-cysteine desulfhydrase family pyridoxal phosphate-dependent enzyme